jgi:hypothetical protein
MQIISVPCPENDYLGGHAELIISSLYRLTGRDLVDPELSDKDRYRLLFEAPFCIVSHNTEADPVFNYANKADLDLFEMNWNEFTNMPSRLSAEPQIREERERLLAHVNEYGFIDDYKGVRVSSTGKRFLVEDAIVWNLIDETGNYLGQAAVLFR